MRKKEKNIYKDHRIESCLQQALYIIMYVPHTVFFTQDLTLITGLCVAVKRYDIVEVLQEDLPGP